MAYQVLARRYRPQTFAEVIGQEHVTRVLAGAVATQRVAHGYLFTGPRGVGKTSTARILAKALNCERGPEQAPCNQCDVCNEITAGRSLDVLEIDGASSGGIDQVRELRENARYAPSGGRFKLYIIDEVHQVTAHGFNALLKTLEEPPAHVVFVLATTEVQKVPDTIVSRVQRFDFRRLAVVDIEKQLEKIVKQEKFRVDPGALRILSQRAQGSLRDAEVLLDQVVAAAAGDLDRAEVERLLGLTGVDTFLALTERIAAHDGQGALALLDSVLAEGANIGEFATGFIEHLRHLLLLAVSRDLASTTGLTDDLVGRYVKQLESWTKGDVARILGLALGAVREMRRSEFPRVYLELALVEMAELSSTADLRALLGRLDALGVGGVERGVGGGTPSTGSRGASAGKTQGSGGSAGKSRPASMAPSAASRPTELARGPLYSMESAAPAAMIAEAPGAGEAEEAAAIENETEVGSDPGRAVEADPNAFAVDSGPVQDPRWREVIERVKVRKTSLASLLAEAHEVGFAHGVLQLGFPAGQSFYRGKVLEPRNMAIVAEEVRSVFGDGVRIEVGRGHAPGPAPRIEAEPRPKAAPPTRFSAGVEEVVERFDGIILD